jgi:acetyl/propionyl-CoA carboxylase alpha subunit
VSANYDPMLAKIIAYGEHRGGAIRRLDYALSQLQLLGLRNNIAFLRRVLMHPDHLSGNITTNFIADHPEVLVDDAAVSHVALIVAGLAKTLESATSVSYWRNNPYRPIRQQFVHADRQYEVLLTPEQNATYLVQVGGSTHSVTLRSYEDGDMTLDCDGLRQTVTVLPGRDDSWWVHAQGNSFELTWVSPLPEGGHFQAVEGSLRAPMPGQVVAIMVQMGQQVRKGDVLLILEAMKMEHRIISPCDGHVTTIHYQAGQPVQADTILLELQPLSEIS